MSFAAAHARCEHESSRTRAGTATRVSPMGGTAATGKVATAATPLLLKPAACTQYSQSARAGMPRCRIQGTRAGDRGRAANSRTRGAHCWPAVVAKESFSAFAITLVASHCTEHGV